MDITPAIPEGRQVVQAYGDGSFQISGVQWPGAVLISPRKVFNWGISSIDQITIETLQPLLDLDPAIEILLLGCGARMQPVDLAVRAAVKERGITTDIMDSGAACRTYNVLMAEDRRVAAAVIAVS